MGPKLRVRALSRTTTVGYGNAFLFGMSGVVLFILIRRYSLDGTTIIPSNNGEQRGTRYVVVEK